MKVWKIVLSLLLIAFVSLPVSADNTKWRQNVLVYYISQDEYAPLMKNAFAEWQSLMHQRIQFYNSQMMKTHILKENVTVNDIIVSFERVQGEDAANDGSTTLTQTNLGAIRHADIVIKIKQDNESEKDETAKEDNDKEISIIMQHQVGKALGLPDSDNPDSVMYKEVSLNQKILPEDIDKLFKQYGFTQTKPLKTK